MFIFFHIQMSRRLQLRPHCNDVSYIFFFLFVDNQVCLIKEKCNFLPFPSVINLFCLLILLMLCFSVVFSSL
uniref:Ovule protein n=1 Tax=Panagrolaimus sp. PS1159 TaxID=55785 RepID=A0AC35G6S9_9BILA